MATSISSVPFRVVSFCPPYHAMGNASAVVMTAMSNTLPSVFRNIVRMFGEAISVR
jgi:hypothetical protein